MMAKPDGAPFNKDQAARVEFSTIKAGRRGTSQNGAVDFKGRPADKRITGGWRSCICIFGNETIDRIAFFGIAANLVTFMATELHQGTAQSAKNVNNWYGTIFMLPLLGGFVADTYLGKFWTISITSVVYLLGLVFLTLAVSVHFAAHVQFGLFFSSLYLVAVGSGTMKPCVLSFGGDQFDEDDPDEMKRKVSFFNWWVVGIHLANIIAVTLLVYVQEHVGWSWGFGIPAFLMTISMLVFFSGARLYRYKKPHGSPLTTICHVLVAAARKSHLKSPPVSSNLSRFFFHGKLTYTNQCMFLDKAAFKSEKDELVLKSGNTPSPWNLCTLVQVEETKLVVKLIPIWLGTLLFSAATSQIPTLFVKQGSTMKSNIASFKIPAASMTVFTSLAVVAFLPVYDRLLVPLLRRVTKDRRGISMLQRMGVGLALVILAMISAALVEEKRLHAELTDKRTMTIFWLLPQYLLLGLAEALTYTGQLEFFYDQAPDSMRSLGLAFQLTSIGVGNFLSSFLITIVQRITAKNKHPGWIPYHINDGHLDRFYILLAALNAASLVLIYLPAAWCYKYKSDARQQQEDPVLV